MPQKYTIDDLKAYARDRGGVCTSNKYIGIHEYYSFKCANGHSFKSRAIIIRRKTWCRKCSYEVIARKQKDDIKDIQKYALRNKGRLLTKTYSKQYDRLDFVCQKGHSFQTTWASMKNNQSFCRFCSWDELAKARKSDVIKLAKALAAERKGKLISKSALNQHTKLVWKCGICKGEFKNTYANVGQGSWCPNCKGKRGEAIVREVLSAMTGLKWPRKRPEWLAYGEKGAFLELDGYNQKHGLAFEHQGDQHHKKSFLNTEAGLAEIQKRDRFKIKMCKKNGVSLIVIDQVPNRVSVEELIPQLKNWLRKNRVPHKKTFSERDVNWSKVYGDSGFDEIAEFVSNRGGNLISKKFVSHKKELKVRCGSGHLFYTSLSKAKAGSWCPICHFGAEGVATRLGALTIPKAIEFVRSKGGKIISGPPKKPLDKVTIVCKRGHVFETRPRFLARKKSFCMRCSKTGVKRKTSGTIEEMRTLARQRGGKCLSVKHLGVHGKLSWRCKEGHKFMMAPAVAKRSWCRICGYKKGWKKRQQRREGK